MDEMKWELQDDAIRWHDRYYFTVPGPPYSWSRTLFGWTVIATFRVSGYGSMQHRCVDILKKKMKRKRGFDELAFMRFMIYLCEARYGVEE